MRRFRKLVAFGLVVLGTLALGGCESSGISRTSLHVGYYYGPGWYDPFYGRPCCYGRPPVYRPRPPSSRPPGYRPPVPVHLPSGPPQPAPFRR